MVVYGVNPQVRQSLDGHSFRLCSELCLCNSIHGYFGNFNFEKCLRDRQIRDLYLLMRKLLEKTDWPEALGRELMTAYEKIKPISAYAYIDLYYRLAYPEKFWKIANHYYNSKKTWIPDRSQQKLDVMIQQLENQNSFLEYFYSQYVS